MTICFSATASFCAGLALLGAGYVTTSRSSSSAELPFAAIPVFFGIQQIVEGYLWLNLPAQTATTHTLTVIYLLFSNVLWPIYVPAAIWMLEPLAQRRKLLAIPLAIGVIISLFFLAKILTEPLLATIKGMHINYDLPHPHHDFVFALYATATCLAPLLSSYKSVILFGVAIIVSMFVSYSLFHHWFASVWCFFAAIMSIVILFHFSDLREIRSMRHPVGE